MSRRTLPLALLVGGILAGAACAPRNPELSAYRGVEFAIESFYERYAFERNATCLRPEMSIAAIRTLEDTPQKLVLEVRYFWEDRAYGADEDEDEMFPLFRGARWCSGFDTRIFTLAKRPDGSVSVISMTGPQRGSG
ncbi:MAG: hypothetical protein RMK73_13985 [Geminicoccaceae bacterium]|nr:hypothetical protein [Geminicoccaceae bacterium]MCS7267898.1 hypothetical protein [Geminicoccaceae bacterium]MDW8124472.1 hypothetical protein [Geminicoccaceae bacterium]MDW8342588.1 hypothetical protein [Geminicoccaceae bacterium]